MIEQCDFVNLVGERWQFNTASCPLHDWDVEYDVRPEGEEQERLQEHGIWPSRTYLGKCLIHLEGTILRDTGLDYATALLQLKRIILPRDERQVQRKLGDLYIRYTGMGEAAKAEVTLDGNPRLPKAANYPTVGDFFITFKAFKPHFIGVGSGRSYVM